MKNKISRNNIILSRMGFTISIAQHKEADSRMHDGERTLVQEIAFWKDDGAIEIVRFGKSSTSFFRSLQEVFGRIDQLARENSK